MEMEYGVGITNRFAFLYKDTDKEDDYLAPLVPEIKQFTEQKKRATQSGSNEKTVEKSAANAGKGGDTKKGKPTGESKPFGGRRDKDGETKDADGRKEKDNNKRTVERKERDGYKQNDGRRERDNRNRNDAARRDGRAPSFQRDGSQRNQRNVTSRDNAYEGKAIKEAGENSGTVDTKHAADVDAGHERNKNDGETPSDEAAESSEENQKNMPESEPEPEPEPETFTLNEWKAMQAPREKPVFNVRKAGEGEDVSMFSKMTLKKKVNISENEEDFEAEEVFYPQRASKFKLVSDVGFKTGYQRPRRGGGRGSTPDRRNSGGDARDSPSDQSLNKERPRGGGMRGRGGRGRGFQKLAPVPRIDDVADFPTLG